MISRISGLLFRIINGSSGEELVNKLDLPPESRRYVVALRHPDDPSCILYILTSVVLSERSAEDVDRLVRALKPHAVLAGIQSHLMLEFALEEHIVKDLESGVRIPDSFLDAIKHLTRSNQDPYTLEQLAAVEVQKAIFGTSPHGDIIAAKRAAADCGSAFRYLRLFISNIDDMEELDQGTSRSKDQMNALISSAGVILETLPQLSTKSAECPEFAESLFSIFKELDQVNRMLANSESDSVHALSAAQRVLFDVAAGREPNPDQLALIRRYRLTLEFLRHEHLQYSASNKSKTASASASYALLSDQDKCEVLLAKALQNQTQKYKVVVTVLNGTQALAVRKYWNFSVPKEVAAQSDYLVVSDLEEDDGAYSLPLAEKGFLALGAGAGAFGVSRLLLATKSLKVASVQNMFWKLLHKSAQRPERYTFGKAFVGVAKRGSLGAVHWSFYGLIRELKGLPSSKRPWMLFGGSVLTAAGLFWAGGRVEAAIEAIPSASSVSRLGRGVAALKRTETRLGETRKDWEEIYGTLYHKKIKY